MCPSEKIVHNGECMRRGPVRRYLYRSCGREFSGIGRFADRHLDADVIRMGVRSMATANMSTDETHRYLKIQGTIIDASAIHRWPTVI